GLNNPILIFSSTNKVYGGMEDIEIMERNNRHEYKDLPLGIPENRLLDFHSPYGCSKGAADQYVRDYSRIYGLRTVVFRQSCIYGKRQFGIEDQGWVAWFTIAASLDRPITIYGDGKQIRDVLFVDDLIQAFISATKMIDKTVGKIYNIGGGAENTMSLLELIAYLEEMLGKKIAYTFSDWRPGDQPVYVSDIRKAKEEFGWEPTISVKEGVERLADWVSRNKDLFQKLKIV
ncbi:MAG: GDP-mannose 4,6-dehydratase, partial [bacterium]|nr:GDP-mannose 4,6-dehydratase [bacterium]